MSLEALWTLQFRSAVGWQVGGVIVLETGRIFGGDSAYYYIGDYQAQGDAVTARIAVEHYEGPLGDAFGTPLKSFTIQGHFQRNGNVMTGEFWRPQQPAMKLPGRLMRRADLP